MCIFSVYHKSLYQQTYSWYRTEYYVQKKKQPTLALYKIQAQKKTTSLSRKKNYNLLICDSSILVPICCRHSHTHIHDVCIRIENTCTWWRCSTVSYCWLLMFLKQKILFSSNWIRIWARITHFLLINGS